MVSLTIDGQDVRLPRGTTILEAAKSIGIEIPHFCYHPKLSIDGNCRMCVVEVKGCPDLVISCRETIKDGMDVCTSTDRVRAARASVLEFMLINHPLDCPVCDRSGECMLQDYYVAHSLKPSRFREDKIKKSKMMSAGPYVILDAERCIGCTRCIRFCEEVVGRHEIGFVQRGGHQEIAARGTLNNKYSLCTVDLCPVGALMSKDFCFKKRVWFLKSSPAICTGCATGCNVWMDHEGGVAYRMRPRENDAVNGCWMCDDGRMTYKRLTSECRLTYPQVKRNGSYHDISWDEAIDLIGAQLKKSPPDKIAGILSAQATLEENAAFDHLFRSVLTTTAVFAGGNEPDPAFADHFLRAADTNPNTAGAALFARDSLTGAFDTYVVIGGMTEKEIALSVRARPAFSVLAASHLPPADWPDVIVPLAPVEEQEGTLINRQRRLQRTLEAYPPKGESRPGWWIADALAARLGAPMNISSTRNAYDLARRRAGILKDIMYDAIAGSGIVIPTEEHSG